MAKLRGVTPYYQPGTKVFDLVTKEDEVFYRLHSAANKSGSWVIRGEAIDRSLTPAELRLKYSLPVTPDFITEVQVGKGTLLQRSLVNENFGGGARAVQYQILDFTHVRFGRTWGL
jgi:hypothetical protein